MDEIWKKIPGYGENYEASSLGRIRSIDRVVTKRHFSGKLMQQKYAGRILNPSSYGNPAYMSVHLGVDKKKINISVHRLVLFAFVGKPRKGEEGCHNNGDSLDNRAENLRWDTHKANNRDRLLHGNYAVGEDHAMAKFSEDLIKKIRSGRVSKKDSGVSHTHFYRIKKGASWKHI